MPRAPAPPRPNPLRDRPGIKKPPPLPRQAAAAAARANLRGQRRGCPNPSCRAPEIVDGICHGCGTVVDDSNIVSEVQFGESSSGAAVVQGSFLGADQGTARSMGSAFIRAGGGESREATTREGRTIIQGIGSQFRISANIVQVAMQTFKLAVSNNFIQGRRMDMVCAVCLYTACRKFQPCTLMLIDFADRVQVNVFKLGRVFKALHETIPGASGGIMPIVPEDLVWRFTSRLEFGELNDKVAEDAIRMAQRMSKDWMVMGRRPSGVVGACIILAARMNNFRRTVTEVVYVVKVTVQTIQKRLEEFKQTESSTMTVENFLTNEFLESAHDPPSFYRKDPAWQAKQKKRKRRDMGNYGYKSDDDESDDGVENPNKRSKTSESNAPQPAELRKDAQGFTIPPLPTPAPSQTPAPASSATASPLLTSDIPIDPDLMDARIEKEVGSTFRQLVAEFGDQLATPEVEDEEVEEDADPATDVPKKRGRKKAQEVHVNPEWENAELEMEDRISDLISDPHTMQHAANYAMAQQRVAAHMLIAEHQNPQKEVSMDTHIGVDEFADDPEVQNCLLSPEDVKRKEKVWVNENKAWLRQQQAKLWAAKQAENRPPKAKRNRKPKAQMGTGQKSPANTPAEAAVAVLKERALSKKINYGSIEDVFAGIGFLRNKGMGSAATSRASSEFGDSETASRAESEAPSLEDSDQSFLIQPKSRSRRSATATPQTKSTTPGQPATTTEIDDEDDEEGDEDDYVDQDTPEPTAEQQARRVIPTEDEPEDDWKDGFGDQMEEEDYDDAGMGDLDDDEGAFDNRGFDDDETGYGINDDDY